MKNLDFYKIMNYVGCGVSIILLIARHFEKIEINVFQTLIPMVIPFIAFWGTCLIKFFMHLNNELKNNEF